MKQTTDKSIAKTAAPIGAALFGTTGIAILGAAAVGVAGYFAWKNREKILGFVENYVDLPESLQSLKGGEEKTSSDVGTLASPRSTYTQPTVEHRM